MLYLLAPTHPPAPMKSARRHRFRYRHGAAVACHSLPQGRQTNGTVAEVGARFPAPDIITLPQRAPFPGTGYGTAATPQLFAKSAPFPVCHLTRAAASSQRHRFWAPSQPFVAPQLYRNGTVFLGTIINTRRTFYHGGTVFWAP